MIWLIGNRGMLGTELSEAFERSGADFVGSDREVSILDPAALEAFADAARAQGRTIDWIVNCAAYTAVDKAEDEVEVCRTLNAIGPEIIARTAERLGASLLHISTDYVFDGAALRPYREDDPTGPTGVYGQTKEEGERRARNSCARTVIVRTAWLYGKHGPNFVATMLRLMKERDSVGVVADQRGTPTWARDLAEAIVAIIRRPSPVYGIFHYTNAGETTWYDFAREIHRTARERGILERDCEIRALTTAEYPTKARRPAYSVLSKEKIVASYGIQPPDWRTSLAAYLADAYPHQNGI